MVTEKAHLQNKKMSMETYHVQVYRGTRGHFAPKTLLVTQILMGNNIKFFQLSSHC